MPGDEALGGGLFSAAVAANPYPYYQRLRNHAPVCRLNALPFWVVSRYDDVLAILRSPELFSSSVMEPADRALLGADPPAHSRVRKIFSRVFSRAVDRVQHKIRWKASGIVDQLVDAKDWDLVDDLAVPLSAWVIGDLLGVEPAVHKEFRYWSQAVLVEATGRVGQGSSDNRSRIEAFDAFFSTLVDLRRDRPGDDLLTLLLQPGSRDDFLTTSEVLSLAKLLVIAGVETTTSLIASTVYLFLSEPDLLESVCRGEKLMPAVIEETLRYDPPVQFVLRRATTQVDITDVPIAEGEIVMALLASANRDERKFPRADQFDPVRPREGHMAFGFGPHYCIGASLARREAAIALETLLKQLPRALLTRRLERVDWLDSRQLRSPKHLLLRSIAG